MAHWVCGRKHLYTQRYVTELCLNCPEWFFAEYRLDFDEQSSFIFTTHVFTCAYVYLCCVVMQHDSTVAALLSAMGVFNNLAPPYASQVIVELFNTSGQFSVKVWYRNDSEPSAEPSQMIIPGKSCIIYQRQ